MSDFNTFFQPKRIGYLLLKQMLFAAVLYLLAAILWLKGDAIFPARELLNQIMTTDFNFKGINQQFEKNFSFRPVFFEQLGTGITYQRKNFFLEPIKEPFLLNAFQRDSKGVLLLGQRHQQVFSAEAGKVVYSDLWRGKGALILQHANLVYTYYLLLQANPYREGDFVGRGEVIGIINGNEQQSNEGYFYFALQEGGQFVDPMGMLNAQ